MRCCSVIGRGDSRRRGTAMALGIILSVIITGLVMSLALAAGVQSQIAGAQIKDDQAFYAAEAGAQRGLWKFKKDNTWRAAVGAPLTGTVGGGGYSVTCVTGTGNQVVITAVGSVGTVQETVIYTVAPPAPGAATLATGGSVDLKNVEVNGDLCVGQNAQCSSGSSTVSGNVTYGGTFDSGHITVGGTPAPGAFTPIDFNALGTALRNAAGLTFTTSQSGRTFDFTRVAGSQKVIYVDGDVIDPVFIGGGTLYASGKITFTGNNVTAGAAGAPVYLVAEGDISTQKIAVVGGVYTRSDWIREQFTITGMAYVAGTLVAYKNPTSTITQGAQPWFDIRGGGGSSAVAIRNVSGVMP